MSEIEFHCCSPSCAAKLLVVGYSSDLRGEEAARRAGWVKWSGGWMCPRCVWGEE